MLKCWLGTHRKSIRSRGICNKENVFTDCSVICYSEPHIVKWHSYVHLAQSMWDQKSLGKIAEFFDVAVLGSRNDTTSGGEFLHRSSNIFCARSKNGFQGVVQRVLSLNTIPGQDRGIAGHTSKVNRRIPQS